jgi:hypothetical protein
LSGHFRDLPLKQRPDRAIDPAEVDPQDLLLALELCARSSVVAKTDAETFDMPLGRAMGIEQIKRFSDFGCL